MSVTPFNIMQGPAVLYVAPYGTSVATIIGHDPSAVPMSGVSGFVDVGGTTGGITVEVDETLTDIKVDQLLDPVGARLTGRTIQVTTTLMENTLANLQLVLTVLRGPQSRLIRTLTNSIWLVIRLPHSLRTLLSSLMGGHRLTFLRMLRVLVVSSCRRP